jgi:hypothetical protein
MKLRLPFKDLVCRECKTKLEQPEHGLKPDYVVAEVAIPEGGNRPARKVDIDVVRMRFEDIGEGFVRGHVEARVPCINGDHEHDIDVTDIYRAPQLHLEGAARCPKGHEMTFERRGSWEYTDNGEFGGVILVSGILSCTECRLQSLETLRFDAPRMAEAEATDRFIVDVTAATTEPQP